VVGRSGRPRRYLRAELFVHYEDNVYQEDHVYQEDSD